ncbi:MAG: dihydrofolate reductase [Bacteroidales bacterium]|jgi:dihydrofolate reductase|nr:dihydrofolate reductase [Bacteroidales bacterium]
MAISLIAAIDSSGGIGYNNKLLFHIKADLRRFKTLTSGHTIIMGRKTLLSLPKWPLPNRRHIVLTTDADAVFPGCYTVASVEAALALTAHEPEVFVIGGESVYRQFIPLAHKIYLTTVEKSFKADAFFPDIDVTEWRITGRQDFHDDENNLDCAFIDLERYL